MPAQLPKVNGTEAIKAFGCAGFALDRVRGSHHVLKKPGHKNVLVVPVHAGKTLGAGLLRALIRDAGLTVDEFCSYL